MTRTVAVWILLVLLALGCSLIEVVPPEDQLKTEIPPDTDTSSAPTTGDTITEGGEGVADEAVAEEVEAQAVATPESSSPTPVPPTPIPITPTPGPYFLRALSQCPPNPATDIHGCCPYNYAPDENNICRPIVNFGENEPPPTPRHGLLIALILPLLVLGIPWVFSEFFVIRYVQPKGIDLSTVRIKAQDGLFIEATISLTARRSLTLASTRMTWGRVREFVEKTLEQELIHEALNYPSLEELELNLRTIVEKFKSLSIVHELSADFGLEVMRFNVESRFPQETMDAINRKAEASAGGTAYLAFAAAAHLDPDSSESRQLYTVYQETTGRVDAARNLGGGLTNIAEVFNPRDLRRKPERDNDNDASR